MIDTTSIKLPIVQGQDLPTNRTQCCEVSIPFPQSLVFNQNQLSVETTNEANTEKGEALNALCKIIAYWPDRSFKWVKLIYQYSNQASLFLKIDRALPETAKLLKESSSVDIAGKNAPVDSYDLSYKYAANTIVLSLADNLMQVLNASDEVILSLHANDLKLTDANDQTIQVTFTQANITKVDDLKSKVESAASICIEGHFLETLIQFTLIVEWLAPYDLIKFDLQIHLSLIHI